jgi:HemY protein
LRLLRTLNKRDALHPAAARQMKTLAYRAQFAARRDDPHALVGLWQAVPSSDKRVADVALVAAQAFNSAGLANQARLVIENAIASEWDPRLAEEYARSGAPRRSETGEVRDSPTSPADDPRFQIERAERWVREHPGDPSASYALGALCVREGLWGKAQIALRSALAESPEPRLASTIHLELGRLFDAVGDAEQSREHFRAAALVTRA